MTVQVILSKDGKGIELLATGVVYGHEIIEANELIIKNVLLENIDYHLIDKSECIEYSVTHKDIKKLSGFDKIFAEANNNVLMAIIESEHLKFNLTDLWQAHVEEHKLKNKSFSNRKLALEWLANHMK